MLAAMANVNDISANPVEAGEVNILGVANVLEGARRADVNRVVLAITA
jgi:nucleoside-diphosphate-sugar epimerase